MAPATIQPELIARPGRPEAARATSRIQGLDVLRGVAAISVVLYHYTTNYQRVFGHSRPPFASLPCGSLGVELFFIISGFVIFMTLEKTQRAGDFVWSRFSRLYPAYWPAVVLTFLVMRHAPTASWRPTAARAVANLSMLQHFAGVGDIDGVYWTLRVELCFYALMLLLFMCGQLRWAELWLLGLAGLEVLRTKFLPDSSPMLHHHAGLARMVGLAEDGLILRYAVWFVIGIALYRVTRKGTGRCGWIVVASLLYIAAFAPRVDAIATVIFTALAFAAARGWLALIENPLTLFLGAVSYTLYLTHQNIGYMLIRWAEGRGTNPNVAIAGAVVFAIAIAALLTYTIEQPALRWLRGRPSKGLTTENTESTEKELQEGSIRGSAELVQVRLPQIFTD